MLNKYTLMQQQQYDSDAANWSIDNRDPVVGSFDAHNNHKDYDLLFEGLETKDKLALDFGCGPGRNIVKFNGLFKQIDGVDISEKNLENANLWLKHNNIDTPCDLFKCNGVDLNIVYKTYDVIFSTICMQHICVHEIRLNYFKEFYRLLNKDGIISIQMGYGNAHPRTVDYFANHYDALATNSGCDTRIERVEDLENDLVSIGFKNFSYQIRPVGPGDAHSNWIFFRAQK
jgi:SAM-dependent methyltransferase